MYLNGKLDDVLSLCPVCLERITGHKDYKNNNVYLVKECQKHGIHRALIWRGAESYRDWGAFGREFGREGISTGKTECPYVCGLCPDHKSETCLGIIEVTERCNLSCPVCFARAGEQVKTLDPDLAEMEERLWSLFRQAGPCPVQLSGGEPTLRNDLPAIAGTAQRIGFDHIIVNTNGLRIAEDGRFTAELKDNGVETVYLQFDGTEDDIYRRMRGRNLFQHKVEAIKRCSEVGLGAVLVPTILPQVNDGEVGRIIDFAKHWVPTVKGIHIQPMSYFGRYPHIPSDETRITLPDVLREIETQTAGEIMATDFVPRRHKESYCGFAGLFVLTEEEKLLPLNRFGNSCNKGGHSNEKPFIRARRYLNRYWKCKSCSDSEGGSDSGTWKAFYDRLRTHSFSITCMPFQDAWNVELSRLENCCTHVAARNGKLVPFCVYYLTGLDGRRLY